ncbi:MAG: L,D-transpeptidase [Acidobacteriia bacterium]|nr:L,D-transpeptidase [Terriglobia bacterium]
MDFRRLSRSTWAFLLCLLWAVLMQACLSSKTVTNAQADAQRNGTGVVRRADLNELRSQARALENKVRRLEAVESHLYPGGPVILVDTARSRITLMLGARIIVQGTCSTGNGMELADASGKRSWTFDTPRGHFRVVGKVANPVWYRPDWSYIEEGEPIPKDRSQRATANVLGDYAIAFGNGFFIHGTLYTRLLGANVTHGCIRVDDGTLKKLYAAAQPGTPIWIY